MRYVVAPLVTHHNLRAADPSHGYVHFYSIEGVATSADAFGEAARRPRRPGRSDAARPDATMANYDEVIDVVDVKKC